MPQDQADHHDGKLSIAKVNRKIAKPIMEKKRRARINASLNELKNLLVEVLQKEGCRHSSKMEKADILEMAVRHLKNLQRQQAASSSFQSNTSGIRDQFSVSDPHFQCDMNQPLTQLSQQFSSQAVAEKNTAIEIKSATGIIVPQPIKLDSKTGLPISLNGQPVQMKHTSPSASLSSTGNSQSICQPVMTRMANGELAVVLPQTFLNQRQFPGNCILPVFTLPSSIPETQSDVSIKPSNHLPSSSAPLSPVWRPW